LLHSSQILSFIFLVLKEINPDTDSPSLGRIDFDSKLFDAVLYLLRTV